MGNPHLMKKVESRAGVLQDPHSQNWFKEAVKGLDFQLWRGRGTSYDHCLLLRWTEGFSFTQASNVWEKKAGPS